VLELQWVSSSTYVCISKSAASTELQPLREFEFEGALSCWELHVLSSPIPWVLKECEAERLYG